LSELERRGGGPVRLAIARARKLLRRARRLPDPVRLPETFAAREQWQRIVLNDSIDVYLDSLGSENLRAAEISGDTHAGRGWREYVSLSYPGFDLLEPVEDPGRYDVVICEQVLEHVPDPWLAAEHLRDLCAPGGRVIVSTPFLVRVHEEPILHDMRDYWRFTPRGLRTLLERAGLEVARVESWGNRDSVAGDFDHWSAYRWWHSLRNEPHLPVQVWAFARRPDDETG
jgi:SAM-dependent methyltransferase